MQERIKTVVFNLQANNSPREARLFNNNTMGKEGQLLNDNDNNNISNNTLAHVLSGKLSDFMIWIGAEWIYISELEKYKRQNK